MSIYDGLLTKTVYFAQIKSSKIFNPSQIYL